MAIKTHKFRSSLITLLAVMVILFAVVFSLFRLVVPYITNYGGDIEAELTQQLGMKVKINKVNADIAWLVPRLKLLGVDLYDVKADQVFLHFDEISLSINWFESFRTLKPELGTISLVGLDLDIERDINGRFIVQGLRIEDSGKNVKEFSIPEELNTLLENSSMYLVDSTLRWTDQLNNNQHLVFNNVNLALINNSPSHKLSIDMQLPEAYGEHIELIMDISGPLTNPWLWNGRLFAGIKNLRLKNWFNDYWQYIDFTGEGRLDANVWLEWHDQELMEFNVEFNANELALHYLDGEVYSWELDGINSKTRWKRDSDGWNLDVRDLEITRNKRVWPIASSVSIEMDEKKNIAGIKSNFLRIEDLAHLAGLGSRFLPLENFDWNATVSPYKPAGDLYDIKIIAPLDYLIKTEASARFADLSYHSLISIPSVSGLDGQLIYNEKHTVLELDSQNVALDFNGLFRNELFFTTLRGRVGIINDYSGWSVKSDAVLMNTKHLNAMTYFKIDMPVDEPVHMNLVSNFEKGIGASKGLYFPTKIMSDNLVKWLDDALVEMDIPKGGVVFNGYLKDFPFAHNEGVFEVLFDVKNATLQYMPDWPALKNMQAEVRFNNQGMSIQHGSGNVFGTLFENTSVDIDNFNNTRVSVDGKLHGPLFDVLKFVEQSPLKNVLGSYITSFGVEGDASLDLNLQIPISSNKPTKVVGAITFKDNSIYLPNENYNFKHCDGQLRFTEKGVSAKKLSATLDGYPVEMKMATINKGKKPFTHISAQGYLPVKSILSHVDFIKPYMQGETDWKVDLYFPRSQSGKNEPFDIFVNSNLKGIRSTLPGPFFKTVDENGPFKLHLSILPDEIKSYIDFTDKFKLSANLKDNQWVVNVDSPDVKGRSTFMNDLSLNEQAVFDLDYINISKFKAADDAPKSKMQAVDYPPVDFYTRKLDWENKSFTDVSMQSSRTKSGMKMDHFELHAPGISVMGNGFWDSNWRFKNLTELDFVMEANDLGLGLSKLNIAESIKSTNGKVSFKWKWEAAPYNFDWKLLQGDSSFIFENGSFVDIEAGAGRLLGMLNFETIFSLDFRNQVTDGFSFDDMSGNLKFSNGHAYTRDIEIESKVADIKMQGRVGMAAKDYDLEVEVFPKVSNAFTAIGVVTGGPILGLGVHFFQKLFGVDEAAGSRSTVSGSWDAPVITEIDKPATKIDSKPEEAATDAR